MDLKMETRLDAAWTNEIRYFLQRTVPILVSEFFLIPPVPRFLTSKGYTGTPFGRVFGRFFPVVTLHPGSRIRTEFNKGFKYELQDEDISTMEDLLDAVEEGWKEYRVKRTLELKHEEEEEEKKTRDLERLRDEHVEV